MSTVTQIGIWERLVQPDEPDMAPAVARQFLKMRFSPQDVNRMNALALKARRGTLTADQQAELDEYLLAGGILELLQAKARLVLGQTRQAE
ncbi:MAG TPA: hypothetical protein VGM03_17365 [Phycisphaerae bacterium]|jgi:hypothetical protein